MANLIDSLVLAGYEAEARGDWTAAATYLDECLRLAPEHPEARTCRSVLSLLRGDLEQGFADFEYRWKCAGFLQRDFPLAPWHGEHRPGETIRLHFEQGLGDTLQFVRYAPLVKERCARVVVECQPGLEALIARCPSVDEAVRGITGEPKHASLLSLPAIFGTRLETVPAGIPYVFADQHRIAAWREYLHGIPGRKVGICWQGNPRSRRDCYRSIPLAAFEPLANVPDVTLISLHHDMPVGCFPVATLPRLDVSGAFVDTAAVLHSLDLVVTADTAVAHLAGAMGVPVWVALCALPDRRWMLDREDSPWYPSMRLFRQGILGEWAPVFERMARELGGVQSCEASLAPTAAAR